MRRCSYLSLKFIFTFPRLIFRWISDLYSFKVCLINEVVTQHPRNVDLFIYFPSPLIMWFNGSMTCECLWRSVSWISIEQKYAFANDQMIKNVISLFSHFSYFFFKNSRTSFARTLHRFLRYSRFDHPCNCCRNILDIKSVRRKKCFWFLI